MNTTFPYTNIPFNGFFNNPVNGPIGGPFLGAFGGYPFGQFVPQFSTPFGAPVNQFGAGQFGAGQFGPGQFGMGQLGSGQFGVNQFSYGPIGGLGFGGVSPIWNQFPGSVYGAGFGSGLGSGIGSGYNLGSTPFIGSQDVLNGFGGRLGQFGLGGSINTPFGGQIVSPFGCLPFNGLYGSTNVPFGGFPLVNFPIQNVSSNINTTTGVDNGQVSIPFAVTPFGFVPTTGINGVNNGVVCGQAA